MNRYFTLYLTLAALLLGGCASNGIDTTTTFRAPMTEGVTYRLNQLVEIPPLYAREIENALNRHLQRRGYTPSDEAELVVTYYAAFDDRVETRSMSTGPIQVGFRRGGMFIEGYTSEIVNVTDGSLFLSVADRQTGDLVWEGISRGSLTRGKPQKNVQRINVAIDELMAQFDADDQEEEK